MAVRAGRSATAAGAVAEYSPYSTCGTASVNSSRRLIPYRTVKYVTGTAVVMDILPTYISGKTRQFSKSTLYDTAVCRFGNSLY